MTKALGMRVLFNFNPGNLAQEVNPFADCWTEVCATAVDGGGVESNVEDLEPCLSDNVIAQFPGDVKFSEQTIDYKINYGDPSTTQETVEGNVYNALEDCCIERLIIGYCIVIPTAPTPVYATRYAYVSSQTEQSKERNQDMKAQVTLVPTSVYLDGALVGAEVSYSMSAPSPNCASS